MTRPALTHVYPYWAPPLSDPYAPQEEWSEQVVGRMRIVRNRRRARLLKRRGVPMWFNSRERCWMWFIELPDTDCTQMIIDDPHAPEVKDYA